MYDTKPKNKIIYYRDDGSALIVSLNGKKEKPATSDEAFTFELANGEKYVFTEADMREWAAKNDKKVA